MHVRSTCVPSWLCHSSGADTQDLNLMPRHNAAIQPNSAQNSQEVQHSSAAPRQTQNAADGDCRKTDDGAKLYQRWNAANMHLVESMG